MRHLRHHRVNHPIREHLVNGNFQQILWNTELRMNFSKKSISIQNFIFCSIFSNPQVIVEITDYCIMMCEIWPLLIIHYCWGKILNGRIKMILQPIEGGYKLLRGALPQQHHKVGPDKRHPICIMTFLPSWQISTTLLEYVCRLSRRSSHIKELFVSLSTFQSIQGWEQSEPKML